MTRIADAQAFAEEWLAAWNAHDLDRILSHYAVDAVFHSPVAERRVGDGRVVGIGALRHYWRLGLASQPELHFTLNDVLIGHQCLTITYHNHRSQRVAETFEFGPDSKIVRAFACYA